MSAGGPLPVDPETPEQLRERRIAMAVALLKAEGWRVVKLEQVTMFADAGDVFSTYRVVEEA